MLNDECQAAVPGVCFSQTNAAFVWPAQRAESFGIRNSAFVIPAAAPPRFHVASLSAGLIH
jgi:hypothetical protein